jgi:hypothetical protein
VYRLAAHFDLTGTSQRPVSIQLPDLKALEAQATPALGALFVKPEGSLMIAGNASGGVNAGGRSQFEICSIPIPLITIVAMFVFELFLPVVMLLFGLFWMLKLKFCIPPQVEVAAGLNAELAVDGPDLSFSAAASVKAGFAGAFGFEIPEGDPLPPTPTGIPSELAQKLGDNYSPIALHNLAFKAQEAAAQVETHGLETPGIGSNLVWVERVEFQ